MKKSTKGALAGCAAAVLLMGGFGTHAAWNDQKSLPGGQINTGILKLDRTCESWSLTHALSATKTFDDTTLASVVLIPGDVLSRLCTFTVHVDGTNMVNANLTFDSNPLVKDGLSTLSDLDADAVFTDKNGNPITSGVSLTNGDVVKATMSVKLIDGLTGLEGQDLQGLLDSLTVTVTQQ